jgi:hypothetical protein
MAQTGFTPIQIYSSSTAAAAPLAANLTNSTLGSELAINITDGKLFYKDNANAIQVIGWKVVPATAGGTGQTSYAVGDILYANTTTTLAKLADVATGNALISGGVGVAPSWGKIDLTTHVSGTLPTTNGGTGLTSFTANGVLYASSTSALATSANLVYDSTNTYFGIGPAGIAPGYAFQVSNANGEMAALYNNRDSTGASNLRLLKSRGTYASPVVANGTDQISQIEGWTYARNSGDTANAYINSTRIESYVTSKDAQNRVNVALGIWTAEAASGSIRRRAIFDHQGYMRFSATYGLGIQFNGDTAAANALNDYEEGDWTPTLTPTGAAFTAITYSTQSGKYTKIGRQVTAIFFLRTTAITVGAASGSMVIGGLPFTCASNNNGTGIAAGTFNWGGDFPISGIVTGLATTINLYYRTSVNGRDFDIAPSDVGTGANSNDIYMSITYFV